jgi:hypothetical protein
MNFRPFVPEYNAAARESIESRANHETIEEYALCMQVETEEDFIQNRRPFYRLYPGVTEALTRLGIEKLDVSKIVPPVSPLSLEFPVDQPLVAGDRQIVNILFAKDEFNMFIEYRSHVDTFGIVLFPMETEQMMSFLDKAADAERETTKTLLQIVFGVCMIPHSDTSLITPRVLARDREKFESTGDTKYIDRARRNGVYGWDVGRDIPTQDEMQTFRYQQEEPGHKSPHWRMGHFAIRHTGHGHADTTVVWIKETFVNKDLLHKVPHGYHGKESE